VHLLPLDDRAQHLERERFVAELQKKKTGNKVHALAVVELSVYHSICVQDPRQVGSTDLLQVGE
jgi:hypothetical protein